MEKSNPKLQYKDKTYVCYLDLAMSFIRSKWKAVLLCHLQGTPKRFSELQRIISGVSQKVLNEQLKQLEEDGLIIKTIFSESPPRVEFSLTERGKKILPALDILEQWAKNQFSAEIKLDYKRRQGG